MREAIAPSCVELQNRVCEDSATAKPEQFPFFTPCILGGVHQQGDFIVKARDTLPLEAHLGMPLGGTRNPLGILLFWPFGQRQVLKQVHQFLLCELLL